MSDELSRTEFECRIAKRVERYRRMLESSRIPVNRREQALARFREAETVMAGLVEAAQAGFDALPGKKRASDRRALSGLARAVFGRTRREPQAEWPGIVAQAGAEYVQRGMPVEAVVAGVAACLLRLDPSADVSGLRERVRERVVRPVALPRATPAVVGASGRFEAAELEAAVSEPTVLERVQQSQAFAALREALSMLKPWAKKCVMARLARHESDEEIAAKLNMTKDEVVSTLRAAREWVRRYTCFFDDDWYWRNGAGAMTKPD